MSVEQVAELLGLPPVSTVQVAKVQVGDVIVVTVPGAISRETAIRIEKHCAEFWPDNKIAIFCDGVEMKVARPA